MNERSSNDLNQIPEDFVGRARAEGRRLLIEHNVIAADDQ